MRLTSFHIADVKRETIPSCRDVSEISGNRLAPFAVSKIQLESTFVFPDCELGSPRTANARVARALPFAVSINLIGGSSV